eukprot:gene1824-3305_t
MEAAAMATERAHATAEEERRRADAESTEATGAAEAAARPEDD